jgi:hypothetical protein
MPKHARTASVKTRFALVVAAAAAGVFFGPTAAQAFSADSVTVTAGAAVVEDNTPWGAPAEDNTPWGAPSLDNTPWGAPSLDNTPWG